MARLRNLAVWRLPPEHSQALAALAQRTMNLQITVQEGLVGVADGREHVELQPEALMTPSR